MGSNFAFLQISEPRMTYIGRKSVLHWLSLHSLVPDIQLSLTKLYIIIIHHLWMELLLSGMPFILAVLSTDWTVKHQTMSCLDEFSSLLPVCPHQLSAGPTNKLRLCHDLVTVWDFLSAVCAATYCFLIYWHPVGWLASFRASDVVLVPQHHTGLWCRSACSHWTSKKWSLPWIDRHSPSDKTHHWVMVLKLYSGRDGESERERDGWILLLHILT